MLSPLLNMVALAFVFSAILKTEVSNYPVYFLTGSLVWTFFSQATGHAASLTVDALEITRRIYIPRSVFVASAVGVALVNLVLSLVPLAIIMVATRFPFHATWLFLPVSMAIAALFTAGIGLLVFTMASRFVDVRETYLVLLSTWFFVTPIVYTPSILPLHYQKVLEWNPMTYLVEVFRAPLYEGRLPSMFDLTVASVLAVVAVERAGLLRRQDRGLRCAQLTPPAFRPRSS
jgi:ABC-type polysaccharide/polyol phosphate export permease